ncbi:MAG TPA: hypothetical protein PLO44_02065 [Candidatus Paceibacterota bacterium]|nr:hypothetical protein [Candidatus Paceibacterota bacterium]
MFKIELPNFKKKIPIGNKDDVENIVDSMSPKINDILEKVKTDIENCKFDAIIGDDVSGRVPALAFHEFLGNEYKNKNVEKPQILFIAGLGETKDVEKFQLDIKEHLMKNLKHDPSKEVLLVTDFIGSGRTIQCLLNALEELNISYKVATLGFGNVDNHINEIDLEKYAIGNGGIPNIYARKDMSGIYKKSGEIISSSMADRVSKKDRLDLREIIKRTRSQVKELAKNMQENFDRLKENK